MDQTQPTPRTYLFTVRLWLEDLGEGQAEWRGEVQHVVSGERRFFRDWPALLSFLQAELPKKGEIIMSTEENKAIVWRFYEEVFNEKQLDRANEHVASDYLDHGAVPGQGLGLEGAKQRWTMYFTAIPDMHATIDDIIAEGDRVVVRYTVEGTQQGRLMGIPPTGKTFHTSGISIYRLTNGKIVEQWEQADMIGLMQQLGVLPRQGTVE